MHRPFVVVVGDVMLDRHVTCEVVGISPEDETALKIRPIGTEMKAGGAANVANNLVSLGARVLLLSATGTDEEAGTLSQKITRAPDTEVVFVKRNRRQTTMKTRYLTKRGRHIVRVDQERLQNAEPEEVDIFLKEIEKGPKVDMIVVSDYGKGIVTSQLMSRLRACEHRTCEWGVIVDPKGKDFSRYGDVDILTPNMSEFHAAGGVHGARTPAPGGALSRLVVVTAGARGCYGYWHKDGDGWFYDQRYSIPVRAREMGDPTGCGDSFLAGLAFKLAGGEDLVPALRFANACGACAYDQAGVHAVIEEEALMEMQRHEDETDSTFRSRGGERQV